jgi:hypothetical protein
MKTSGLDRAVRTAGFEVVALGGLLDNKSLGVGRSLAVWRRHVLPNAYQSQA